MDLKGVCFFFKLLSGLAWVFFLAQYLFLEMKLKGVKIKGGMERPRLVCVACRRSFMAN